MRYIYHTSSIFVFYRLWHPGAITRAVSRREPGGRALGSGRSTQPNGHQRRPVGPRHGAAADRRTRAGATELSFGLGPLTLPNQT